jgi:DNA-directed RNA polymerase subunit delta
MKRIIVDYSKLTNEILNLLVDKFPDGYDDSNIIRFRNHKDEAIEAVEVRTEDTIYLVKISTKLSERMVSYEDDDDIPEVPEIDAKALNLVDDDDSDDDDDEIDMKKDPESDSDNDGDDEEDDFDDIADDVSNDDDDED